jgi:hypothetical protein
MQVVYASGGNREIRWLLGVQVTYWSVPSQFLHYGDGSPVLPHVVDLVAFCGNLWMMGLPFGFGRVVPPSDHIVGYLPSMVFVLRSEKVKCMRLVRTRTDTCELRE